MQIRTPRTRASVLPLARWLSALAGGALAGLAPGGASAADPADGTLRVSVSAPAGRGCISEEKLRGAVQKRVGQVARRTAVDVLIEDAAPGWVANVAVAGRAGRRSVRTESASCGKLDDGLVLVVTLLVDPEEEDEETPPARPSSKRDEPPAPGASGGSWLPEKPAEDDPEIDPEVGPGPGEPAAPTDDPELEPATPPRADRPVAREQPAGKETPSKKASARGAGAKPAKKVQFALGASAVYALGLVPAGVPGVRGSFAWVSPTPVPIEGSFTYFSEYDRYGGDDSYSSSEHVEMMSLGVTSCPADLTVGRLHFGACAGLDVTRIQHRLEAYSLTPEDPQNGEWPTYNQVDHLMVSPTADLRLDITLWKALRIGAGLEVMTPINRLNPAWVTMPYSGQTLTEPVIFQARLGISLVLPP